MSSKPHTRAWQLAWENGFQRLVRFSWRSQLSKTLVPLCLVTSLMLVSRLLRRGQVKRPAGGRQPLRLLIADRCTDLWFFVLFLTYPSVCTAVFNYFVPFSFAALGEDGAILLRVDLAIDTTSVAYAGFYPYALIMLFVFPIGVPMLFAVVLYRERHFLRELRHLELVQEAEYKAAQLRAAAVRSEAEKEVILQAAKDSYNEAATSLSDKRKELPSAVKLLTAGYELRTFWSVHSPRCARALLSVLVPHPSPLVPSKPPLSAWPSLCQV